MAIPDNLSDLLGYKKGCKKINETLNMRREGKIRLMDCVNKTTVQIKFSI